MEKGEFDKLWDATYRRGIVEHGYVKPGVIPPTDSPLSGFAKEWDELYVHGTVEHGYVKRGGTPDMTTPRPEESQPLPPQATVFHDRTMHDTVQDPDGVYRVPGAPAPDAGIPPQPPRRNT